MRKLYWLLGIVVLLSVFSNCALADNEFITNFHINGSVIAEPSQRYLPKGEGGTLPSLGVVKPLFILVDFPDYSHENLEWDMSADKLQKFFFGVDGKPVWAYETRIYPYESLRAYFDRASYGRLQLDGDVLGWFTAAHDRKYYEENGGPPEILQEAFSYYDQEVDFGIYDSNKDGVIDSVSLLYVTDIPGGYQSMWYNFIYSYKKMASVDNMAVNQLGFMQLSMDHINMMQIILHEFGHFFRMPDLYDSDGGVFYKEGGMWTPDMMMDNRGDYNAFSKLMLGWMENVYIVTEGPLDVSLRPISEAGDMAIVFPEYTSPLSEYFAVEYITENGNNALLGRSLYDTSIDRSKTGGLRILRINAEEKKSGFKYSNKGTEKKLIESVKKGYWETARTASDIDRPFLFRDGEEFTPNSYPSSYGFSGQFTGVSIQDIHIADEKMASFSARIVPKTELQPITFRQVTEVNSAVALIANTEIRLKGKTLPYLLIGKKKVPLDWMDIHASANENRADFLLRKKTGLLPGQPVLCKLVIPKGTFINRNGIVNEETIFDVTVRHRDTLVEKNGLLKNYNRGQFFKIDEKTAGLLYVDTNTGVKFLTITDKGKTSKPKEILKFPDNSYASKFLRLPNGSFAVAAASFSGQQGMNVYFISENIKVSGEAWLDMPNCTIMPFRNGVLAAGWSNKENRMAAFCVEPGMEKAEEIRNIALIDLLTTPGYSSGENAPNTFDIGNGEWLYITHNKLIKIAVIDDEGTVKAFRGWKVGDGPAESIVPVFPGIPYGAIRTGEHEITLFMMEGVTTSPLAVLGEGSLYAIKLDNDLNVVSKQLIRSYAGLSGQDFEYKGQIIRLSDGYALPLSINMTPEKDSSSPIGVVCFLDENLDYMEEAWLQKTLTGSHATVVELIPGKYLIGTWHSFKILAN